MSPGVTPRPSLSVHPRQGPPVAFDVSPGVTPRPSLSGPLETHDADRSMRVAGGHAPAFVERSPVSRSRSTVRVSPGVTPRPSLSVDGALGRRLRPGGVAGGHAPAFVERSGRWRRPPRAGGVAGGHAPAFVERCPAAGGRASSCPVSPGVTPRPSLSAAMALTRPYAAPPRVSPGVTPRPSLSAPLSRAAPRQSRRCRRGSRPGLR